MVSKILVGLVLLLALRVEAQTCNSFASADERDIIPTIAATGLWRGKTAYVWRILGRRSAFTSNSAFNDIVQFGAGTALIPTLTGSEALEVVSSSASDTSAGTGTRSVKVVYLDGSGTLTESAAITLNGVTPVAAGFTALNILWMEAVTGGSSEVSAGDITLRIVSGAVPVEMIAAGGNKSMSGRAAVPVGFTGYITDWAGSAIAQAQDMRLRATVHSLDRTTNARYLFQDNLYIAAGAVAEMSVPWLKIPAGVELKASTITAATTGSPRADVDFTMVIIQN